MNGDISIIFINKCGLSHHNIYLDSGYYWEFRMPVFEGNFKTKLRLELSKFHNGNLIFQKLYSNEIEGNINISQFYTIDRDWNVKNILILIQMLNTKKVRTILVIFIIFKSFMSNAQLLEYDFSKNDVILTDSINREEAIYKYFYNHKEVDFNLYFPDSISNYYDANIIFPKNFISYLNINYLDYNYYFAYSLDEKNINCNGCAKSTNIPKLINQTNLNLKNELVLLVENTKIDTFVKKYFGYNVYLYNNTDSIIKFDVIDHLLYMRIQALDFNNEWKYITNTIGSKCGLSYFEEYLEPGYYWQFKIPKYEGTFKTKLRLELTNKINKEEKYVLYSNEFDGNINIGQFYYTPNIWDNMNIYNPLEIYER
ncbi:MAG: hypothetical protein IPL95_19435 [Saprospiraceae bacterium]|nr:hypothetical protein [Saprospiraceae bacterium]